jgi:hypothetical protein
MRILPKSRYSRVEPHLDAVLGGGVEGVVLDSHIEHAVDVDVVVAAVALNVVAGDDDRAGLTVEGDDVVRSDQAVAQDLGARRPGLDGVLAVGLEHGHPDQPSLVSRLGLEYHLAGEPDRLDVRHLLARAVARGKGDALLGDGQGPDGIGARLHQDGVALLGRGQGSPDGLVHRGHLEHRSAAARGVDGRDSARAGADPSLGAVTTGRPVVGQSAVPDARLARVVQSDEGGVAVRRGAVVRSCPVAAVAAVAGRFAGASRQPQAQAGGAGHCSQCA